MHRHGPGRSHPRHMHGTCTVHARCTPATCHASHIYRTCIQATSHARYIQDGTCICTANAQHTHNACVVYTRFVCSPCVAYAHGTRTCTPIHDTIMTRPRAHAHENAQRICMHMAFTAMHMRSMQASISCTVEARRTYIILMHGTCLSKEISHARYMHITVMHDMHSAHTRNNPATCISHAYTASMMFVDCNITCPSNVRHMHGTCTLTNDSRIWQCHRHYTYRAHPTSAGKIAQHPCICNISGEYKRYTHTAHATLVWYVHDTCTAHERRGTWAALAWYMQYSMKGTCAARVRSFLRC